MMRAAAIRWCAAVALMVTLLPGTTAWADNEAESQARPLAKVEKPQHDFGTVWAGESLRHSFVIENVGGDSLRITKVRSSCGCTTAGDYPKVIPPGQKGEFPFILNTTHVSSGKFNKSITISTDDPSHRQLRFYLTGKLRQHVEVVPARMNFGRVEKDSVKKETVRLRNNTDGQMTLSLDESSSSGTFEATILETLRGKVFEVNITAKPPYTEGTNKSNIVLKTGVEEQPTVEILCTANLPPRLELRPSILRVPSEISAGLTRRVKLLNNGEKAISIASYSADDPQIDVEVLEREAGRSYDIEVTFPAGYELPAGGAMVLISTDDPEAEDLSLEIGALKSRGKEQRKPKHELVGGVAPLEKRSTYLGQEVEIGGSKEKPQLLFFYGSWCGYSRRAMPSIERLKEQYADKGLEVLAIHVNRRPGAGGRSDDQIIEHFREAGMTMDMVLDGDMSVGKKYGVRSFPTIVLVGTSGKVEAVHIGAPANLEQVLSREIEKLLEGKSLIGNDGDLNQS